MILVGCNSPARIAIITRESAMARDKLEREIQDMLDPTGLPYEIKEGGRHRKVILCGRMVTIMPMHGRNDVPGRAWKNSLAQIRRAIAQQRAA